MAPSEGKNLKIDTVFQNRWSAIKKIMKFVLNSKKIGSRVVGVTPGGLPSKTKLYVLVSPNQQHLKI